MATSLDDFRSNVLFGAYEGICPEVGDTGSRVDQNCLCRIRRSPDNVARPTHPVRASLFDGGWRTSRLAGLLGQVEIGQHDVAGLMQQDI